MILCYHKIDKEAKTQWWVTADAFYRHMIDLQSKQVVYLDDYDPDNPDNVVITFDGVYADLVTYALPILSRFNYPFELFIIGETIGKDNSFDSVEPEAIFANLDELETLVNGGGRLQWHTQSHAVLSGSEDKATLDYELTAPAELVSISPDGFKWFAYPHGDVSDNFKEAVKDRYIGALAVDKGDPDDRYAQPRIPVYEETKLAEATISVIIPSYNYGHFLIEAVESVLFQTITPDEILVIDDASTDDTPQIAAFFEDQVTYVRNEQNLGIVENFKKAVSLTSGDYICFLGADNRFRADYLEKCKVVLDRNPEVGIAYNHWVYFGERAGIIGSNAANTTRHPTFPELYFREFPANPTVSIEKQNFIHGSSMYRRKAYDQVGGYREAEHTEDHDLFTRMLTVGWKAELVDEYILEYRQHSKNQDNRVHILEARSAYQQKHINHLLQENRRLREQLKVRPALQKFDGLQSVLLYRVYPLIRKIFPKGSKRTRAAYLIGKGLKTVFTQGPAAVIRRAKIFLKANKAQKQ